MPRNGSGTYSAPSNTWNPATNGTTISSSDWNTTLTDIETAITNSIAKDGQTTITANLPMATYKHTGVGDASARDQYASMGQLQDNKGRYLTSVAGTDTITAVASFSLSAYAAGQSFVFVAAGTNTGATTLNINSIGAKAIQKNGAALVAGDITASDIVHVVYDGTQFQMVSPARTPVLTDASIPTAKLSQKTGADTNVVTGTAGTNGNFISWNGDGDAVDSGSSSSSFATAAQGATADSALQPAGDGSGLSGVKKNTITSAINTTSGTSVDISTSIPATCVEFKVHLNQVSVSGTDTVLIQIGDSGGFETTGYVGTVSGANTGNLVTSTSTTSGVQTYPTGLPAAGTLLTGTITFTLTNASTNTWYAHGTIAGTSGTTGGTFVSFSKSLSATLDRVRVISSGSNTFDNGSANITYTVQS